MKYIVIALMAFTLCACGKPAEKSVDCDDFPEACTLK